MFCAWSLFCFEVLSPFYFCNHLPDEERAGCFTLFVCLLVFCVSSSRCHGLVPGIGLQCVVVAFPGHNKVIL